VAKISKINQSGEMWHQLSVNESLSKTGSEENNNNISAKMKIMAKAEKK
jgi:hypothetical protein